MNFLDFIPLHDPVRMLVLLLGVAGSVSLVVAALGTHKNRVLGASLFTSVFFITQSLILGTPATAAASMVGASRNLMALGSSKVAWLNHPGFAPLFITAHALVFWLLNDFSDFAWYQVLPLTSGIIAVLAPYFGVLVMKVMFSVVSASWLTYEFLVGMHTQMIGESLFFVLNAVAIFVLVKAKLNGVSEVPDLDTAVLQAVTSGVPIQDMYATLTGSIPIVAQEAAVSPVGSLEGSSQRTPTKPIPVASRG